MAKSFRHGAAHCWLPAGAQAVVRACSRLLEEVWDQRPGAARLAAPMRAGMQSMQGLDHPRPCAGLEISLLAQAVSQQQSLRSAQTPGAPSPAARQKELCSETHT